MAISMPTGASEVGSGVDTGLTVYLLPEELEPFIEKVNAAFPQINGGNRGKQNELLFAEVGIKGSANHGNMTVWLKSKETGRHTVRLTGVCKALAQAA